MSVCWDLQIGASLATMASLHARGIPPPETWTFNRASKIETGGDGIPRGFGYGMGEWRFTVLTQRQANVFLSFLSSTSAMGGVAFVWTYTTDGYGGDDCLERFQIVLHRPVDGQDKAIVPNSAGKVYTDVVVKFSHMENV